jgi:DNA-binding MarR family transcriptional regulator
MSMGDLAAALGIDPPNATVLVDDLESRDLVRRRPHPTDRRAKLVEATRKGKSLARKANEILGTPPTALSSLGSEDLEALRRLLTSITPRKQEPCHQQIPRAPDHPRICKVQAFSRCSGG